MSNELEQERLVHGLFMWGKSFAEISEFLDVKLECVEEIIRKRLSGEEKGDE